ncbi:MAG: hypothetical protein AMJ61_10035 [Desulfobacterales bacterium SG8_35_2]|nr:MAG: hypothetical protein AMJ61_10035 [Desulfobacterales bacterium SG8_35_2]
MLEQNRYEGFSYRFFLFSGPHSVALSIATVGGLKTLDLFEPASGGRVFSVPPIVRSAWESEGPGQRGSLFLLLLLGKQKKKV